MSTIITTKPRLDLKHKIALKPKFKGGEAIKKEKGVTACGYWIIVGIFVLIAVCVGILAAFKKDEKEERAEMEVGTSRYTRPKSTRHRCPTTDDKKEGFVRNLSEIYAKGNLHNPLVTDGQKIKKEFDKDYIVDLKKSAIYQESEMTRCRGGKKEKYEPGQYMNDEPADDTQEENQVDNTTIPEYDVDKTSNSGINDGAARKEEGRKCRGKFPSVQNIVVPDKHEIGEPVKGYATGNPRSNGLVPPTVFHGLKIDDRGEGVVSNVSKPIETFGPAISTNSRLAGSSMNIEPITGACFKKYDTDAFFENNSPFPPSLNIMGGEPLKMKYDVNNTM